LFDTVQLLEGYRGNPFRGFPCIFKHRACCRALPARAGIMALEISSSLLHVLSTPSRFGMNVGHNPMAKKTCAKRLRPRSFRVMLYEQILRNNLDTLLQKIARVRQWSPAYAARRYCGEYGLVSKIAAGRPFTVRLYDTAVCRIAQDWPDDKPWPAGVGRPSKAQIKRTLALPPMRPKKTDGKASKG
jgi:hypothetical protein